METLILLIYLADVVEGVKVVSGAAGLVLTVIGGAVYAVIKSEGGKGEDPMEGIARRFAILGVMLILTMMFIPSKSGIYMMSGAYLGHEALNSVVGQKVMKLIEKKIDEELTKVGDAR